MLELGDKTFVIDLDALENLMVIDKNYKDGVYVETITEEHFDNDGTVISKTVKTTETHKMKEYDSTKYDFIRTLFEVLISYYEEFDTMLGVENAFNNTPLPFKISFNTLKSYGILKEI